MGYGMEVLHGYQNVLDKVDAAIHLAAAQRHVPPAASDQTLPTDSTSQAAA
jgi:hypothetical protein